MSDFIKKIVHSKIIIILKRILTLDGDKRFIVSSMTYYLTISLVPLSTIIYFFLKAFNIDPYLVFENLFNKFPEYEDVIVTNLNIFFDNFFVAIITSIISIYIASKGVLNYYHYLQEKFSLNKLKLAFFTERIFVCVLTLLFCLIFAFSQSIKVFFQPSNFIEKMIFYFLEYGVYFLLLNLFNYLLLRKEIPFKNLTIGSLVSAFLLSLSNVAYYFYINITAKESYFGLLTQVIAMLLYLYFVTYSILIGNNITLLAKEKSAGALFN